MDNDNNAVTGENNAKVKNKKESLVQKLFSFRGRRSRQVFLGYLLIVFFIVGCIGYMLGVKVQPDTITYMLILVGILAFAGLYIFLTNIIKRSHDLNISAYIDNLISLGLVIRPANNHLADKSVYERLKNSDDIVNVISDIGKGNKKFDFEDAGICFTEYGKLFCEVCIGSDKFVYNV